MPRGEPHIGHGHPARHDGRSATNPRRARAVDVEGTRRITTALARHDDPAHLVAISIVGCDLVPFGYYRAKADAERLIEAGAVPAALGGGPTAWSASRDATQPMSTGRRLRSRSVTPHRPT